MPPQGPGAGRGGDSGRRSSSSALRAVAAGGLRHRRPSLRPSAGGAFDFVCFVQPQSFSNQNRSQLCSANRTSSLTSDPRAHQTVSAAIGTVRLSLCVPCYFLKCLIVCCLLNSNSRSPHGDGDGRERRRRPRDRRGKPRSDAGSPRPQGAAIEMVRPIFTHTEYFRESGAFSVRDGCPVLVT